MAPNSRLRVVVVTLLSDPKESLLFLSAARLVGDLVLVAPDDAALGSWPTDTRVVRLPAVGDSLTQKRLLGLSATVRQLAPDIVHIHGEPWSTAAQHLVGLGLPVVVHGAENLLVDAPLLYRLRRVGTRRILRRVAGYAAWGMSGLLAARRAGLPLTTPAAVIPGSPPDPAIFTPVALRTADPTLRVVAVGRLVREKGIDGLVRAVAGCGGAAAVSLTVVGDGPQRAELQALARSAGVEVTFSGTLTSLQVHDKLADSDVLVAPSVATRTWQEQWGRAVVEAMMTRRAVVVSNCGELPDLVGDPSWTFPMGDVEALAEALMELRDSPTLRRARSDGALVRAAEFHPDHLAGELVSLWERAAARSMT